jgi:phosphatidyl-myo-inositol dimannoside synthase
MNSPQPQILVVGTGSSGGIGRFERLLVAALNDISQRGVLRFESIWRRRHPSYLHTSQGNDSMSTGEDSIETRMPVFVAQIARAVVRRRPDLVLFLHINLARAAPIAWALGGRRYAIATYGVEVWSPLDRARRHALVRAREVLTISEYTADQIRRHQRLPQGRARVIPLALEPRWLETASETPQPADRSSHQQAPTLLSVSRLEPAARDKGIDRVIRALPAVRAAIPDVRYHIVGDGEDRAYLEQVAVENEVTDSVVFQGLLAHADLINEYRQADVFVLPSQREGFGLVFLEAMAYAKPVIAQRAAAAVEVISDGQTGILVEDDQGLAAAMISVLSEPNRAIAMGRAGLERVHEIYSFDVFTARIEAALLAASG